MSAGFDPAIVEAATRAQRDAARPDVHVFVEANAGSGKTRVLVDRVVNILLDGTAPDRILCVTYTKAAAAEMKERLFDRLGAWSVLADEALTGELTKLRGHAPDAGNLPRARKLFALALETPGGLKIQTIHAFCESLLRRFPLEAGALPGFQTLDDAAQKDIAQTARRQALTAISPDIVRVLLASGGAEAVDHLVAWADGHRHDLRASLEQGNVVDALYEVLDCAPGETPEAAKNDAMAALPRAELDAAAHALRHDGGKQDAGRADAIETALRAGDIDQAYRAYLSVFFTRNGEGHRAARLVSAACSKAAPAVAPLMDAEAERMETVRQNIRTLEVAASSAAALEFVALYLERLDQERERQRALDFDDLIVLAGNLLSPDNAFSGWVGYKLDAALMHALVDEAQDTAPRQWDMIEGLTAEFFAGEGARAEERSLFIVGDEKQSIYSFQGAEPARFVAEGERLEAKAAAAGLQAARPGLDVSFRSAAQVLEAVDQVFADTEVKFLGPAPGRPFSRYQAHQAARQGTPGCVELWPALPRTEPEEVKSIFDPVDAQPFGSARDRLAEALAREIKRMLDDGDAVWQEAGGQFTPRPVEPRDIGVLVWRRTGGFVEELIRQLKLAGVPVAGADRMLLKEQTVVKDLLALGRLAVTSSDDLALAEVLKSPFFDADDGGVPLIDDEALFDLAQARPTSDRGGLWRALLTTTDSRFTEARDALKAWRDKSETIGVYALYAGFLNARSASGETRWARVFARLSEEARDAAEEFLNRALDHDREGGGALASFIAAIEREETPVKRELASQHNEVQIMTVHASKGLERPVIILPDTTRSPQSGRASSLFAHAKAGLIWSPRKDGDPEVVAELRETIRQKQQAEHQRLLYVALTRARDRLIVCGWKQGRGSGAIAEDSWYTRLAERWSGANWVACETPLCGPEGENLGGLRFGPVPARLGPAAPPQTRKTSLPDWAVAIPTADASTARPAAPSSLFGSDEEDVAVVSPLAPDAGYRFRRGDVIHKLLETLPDLPVDRRERAAERFLSAQSDLSEQMRARIHEEVFHILGDAAYAPIFGPGSQAEVSLSGQLAGPAGKVLVRGQVDRLRITDHEVLIIDYKTNRPPPQTVADVAPVYLGQMATYRALLAALHPGKQVRCALLWTDTADLMVLPDSLLDTVPIGLPA
ncbi:double-strand break repair helicase AddA [Maricaulis sp.]|uniref:double-strand break repair helicase AddA n=1 Tax=Maricaulis sp. TaxID=1486257 RepID=UPI00262FBE7A|nr:double-strand break repair helicase AddA [Maricaulis sp.]